MKKLILSIAVIVTFVLFSLHEQQEGNEAQVIVPRTEPSSTSSAEGGIPLTPTPSQGGMMPPMMSSGYKDGSYTGSVANAFYGYIQVKAVITGGKISDVQFLQYPNDRDTSIMINTQAMPYLKSEAIQAQSANVDIVSGATDSSQAFKESLAAALDQAK